MQEYEKKDLLEALRKKLSQASKEVLVDFALDQFEQIQFLKECEATGTQLAIKHQKEFEALRKQSNEYAEQLLKIQDILNREGFLYPDTSLEGCIAGMICDLEMYKKSELKDEQKSNT